MSNPLEMSIGEKGSGGKQFQLPLGEYSTAAGEPAASLRPSRTVDAAALILHSSAYRAFAPAYRKLTGLPLVLLSKTGHGYGAGHQVEFCQLVSRVAAGRAVCQRFAQQVHARAVAEKQMHCSRCFAGLVEIAVPIFNGSEHVATLLTGRVFRDKLSPEVWQSASLVLGKCGLKDLERARVAHEAVPVMEGHQIQAAVNLLKFFAKTVEEQLPGWMLSNGQHLPPGVLKAEEYIADHLADDSSQLHLPEVARHAGIGVQHFCRVFKRSVGLTFSQFVARSRTERAKTLLHDPSNRIAEVALDCGFGSIPTFNRTFKRLVGLSPSQYRMRRGAKI